MLRHLSWAFAIIGCGFVFWECFTPKTLPQVEPIPEDEPVPPPAGILVPNAEWDMGTVALERLNLVYEVINSTDAEAEVLGGTRSCSGSCCFQIVGRAVVPAHGNVEVPAELIPTSEGPFEFSGEMFLQERGVLRVVRLRIAGTAVKSGLPE